MSDLFGKISALDYFAAFSTGALLLILIEKELERAMYGKVSSSRFRKLADSLTWVLWVCFFIALGIRVVGAFLQEL